MPQTTPIESNELVRRLRELPEREKIFYFDMFFGIWGANGFGTLTKKEVDLLIYSLIEKIFSGRNPSSDYEWSKILKITPAKFKSLKLEAYLKYDRLMNPGASSSQILERFFSKTELAHFNFSADDPRLDNGQVKILVEDPVILFEIDQKLKMLNCLYDIDRKGDTLSLSVKDFLMLINAFTGEEETGVIKKLAELSIAGNKKINAIKNEIEKISFKSQSEGEKLIQFLELLGDTFAEKPMKLIKHLKLIFKSQK